MDEETKTYIDGRISEVTTFSTRKLGDTPTDAQQLTPKGYVDTAISSVVTALNTVSSAAGVNFNATVVTVGESWAKGDALSMGNVPVSSTAAMNGTGGEPERALTTDNLTSGAALWAQTYPASQAYIHRVDARLGFGGAGSWIANISLQGTTGGNPSNNQISTASVFTSLPGSSVLVQTFSFAEPARTDIGSVMAIVMNVDNTTNTPSWVYNADSSSYPSGSLVRKTGGTWSVIGGDFAFNIFENNSYPGRAFRATASITSNLNGELAANFIGFGAAAVSSVGSTGTAVVGGVASTQSGLTVGKTYFLSNSAGVISSVQGSFSRKIGLSMDTGTVLIKHDNP
jgi:hypothetical protein